MKKDQSIPVVALISLGMLYLIWGSTFLSVRILLSYVPPMVITFGRNLLSGFLLLLWSILGNHWKKMPKAHLRVHLMAGVLLIALGNGGMAMAGTIVPSGFSSVFMALGPLLLVLFFWISGRRPTLRKIAGTILGLLGIGIMISQKTLAIPGQETEYYWGIFFLSIAVLSWNIGVFRIQISKANIYHFTQVASIQMLTGGFVIFVISYFKGDLSRIHLAQIPMKGFLVFAYLTLIGSLVGYSLFGYLSKVLDATLVATYTYVNPLIALILGYFILDEPLTKILLLASFFILLAVVLITTDKSLPKN